MRLAKSHLDIALFATDVAAQRSFWEHEIGLRFDLELHVREGWRQFRFDAHGSVIKVNDCSFPMSSAPPTGFAVLSIASASGRQWSGMHPDQGGVRLVQSGTDNVVGIGITLCSPDPVRLRRFYVDAMEFEPMGERGARCGDSVLLFEEGPGGSETDSFLVAGPGYRYLTVQIFDADRETAGIVSRGGRIALEPEDFGKIARVAFVKDPDGNWIEISARASLTGVVPGHS